MVVGMIGLWLVHALFANGPVSIAVQILAVGLMIWARITFGLRSFHPQADPTAGGLITSGPYRLIRHPIYASICLFALAGFVSHFNTLAAVFAATVWIGAIIRMTCEERLLLAQYPEYQQYRRRTARMAPFLY